ncbi:hypothetical protein AGR6A_pTi0131 [Agrobacterium sp. NCPPB 925]|nr:hypothetical protein AGR6A_pTi0131 [Agrobacterium sp. NCPPB 925]
MCRTIQRHDPSADNVRETVVDFTGLREWTALADLWTIPVYGNFSSTLALFIQIHIQLLHYIISLRGGEEPLSMRRIKVALFKASIPIAKTAS